MVISKELTGQLFNRYGKEFKKGEVVFHENDKANEMYIVLSGKIKISKLIKSGKFSYEKILATISSGELFGEMALLMPNSKRTASAYIIEDSDIIVIDRPTFYAMIRYNAEFSMKLMERMSVYVERTNTELEELGSAQKKLLIVEEIIINHNESKSDTIKLDSLLDNESLRNNLEIEIIRKILEQLSNIDVIEIDDEKIKIKSLDMLNKFKVFLTDPVGEVESFKPSSNERENEGESK